MAVAEGRLEGVKIQARGERVRNRDFDERLQSGFSEAVRGWEKQLGQGGLVKLTEDLRNEAAEMMYAAGQRWVRQDYKGFLRWLEAAGVPADLNDVYVRALNAEGDKELLAASMGEMVDLLRKDKRLGKFLPGEEQLWVMADKMRGLLLLDTTVSGAGDDGGRGGGGGVNFPNNFDFNPDEEPEKKKPPAEVEVLTKPPSGGQALYDLGKDEPDIPVSEREQLEIGRKIGRAVGVGCLASCIVASMLLCGGRQVLSRIGEKEVGAITPVWAPYEIAGGEENRQAAETLTGKIFGGGDSQHRFIDRFLDNYQGAVDRSDVEFQLAYEVAMREKLRSEGILDETSRQFDREKLEEELGRQGYDYGDIDALGDWVELRIVR